MGLDKFRDNGGRGGGYPPRRRFPGGNSGGGEGDAIGRVPPHDITAEMAVLGAMLLGDRTAVERGLELLNREDFYRDAHGNIFDAMSLLNGKGEPIDIITLQNEMNAQGTLENIGLEYLLQLTEIEFTTANVAYYANIVSEKAVLRRLIEAASQIAGQAYGEVEEVSSLVDQAERMIFEVARKRSGQGFSPLRPLLTDVFERLDTVYQDKGVVTGVDTGFVDLNAMTSGLQEGDLFILAARPAMGKTSLAMGMGQNATLRNKSVAVFSLEMSKEQLVQRMICSEARVDAHKMRTGFLQDPDWDRISAAVQRLWDANLFIDDTTEISALEMRARCRRLQAEYGLDMVIVDYLQLMRGSGRMDANRNEEITTIARGLKGLARELRVPVIALSQLSRAVERREDKRPMLSDLRECVAGATRLYCANTGQLKPIAEICPGDRVLAVNDEQKVVAAQVSEVWKKGVKPTFRLTTETGRVIECTANHPFLTQNGYKSLCELAPSDLLATVSKDDRNALLGTVIIWERVRSVEPAGEQETFDICVPETGNFLAEGITVHNSGAIEAEADIVAFIYRPAYYERKQDFSKEAQDKEDAGGKSDDYQGEEAEIIIAKHRNGPTGTVKLSFLPKYARFDNLADYGDTSF